MMQIMEGYKFMNNQNIVHRDLKPNNILLKGGVFKIADFGLTSFTEDKEIMESKVGTFYYMAPQILLGANYTSKCDIWSLGVIYYQLLVGEFPFSPLKDNFRVCKEQP